MNTATIAIIALAVVAIIVLIILWASGVFSSSCVKTYTIKSGDTCYNIATTYGLSVDNLKTLNPKINCDSLQAGNVLCVCDKTYTIKSGDTCYSIASAYGITVDGLKNMNPGINCDNLQIGQVLNISTGGGGGGGGGGLKPKSDPKKSKKVLYLGYWIDDSSFPKIINDLSGKGITHLVLPFILQKSSTDALSGKGSMIEAFSQLSTANKKLLTDNFDVGVSVGGARNMNGTEPFSNTYSQGPYMNNPDKYAQDIYNIATAAGLGAYFDLDIERIQPMSAQSLDVQKCADFIGSVCKKLKNLNPYCQISHAPQCPYFCQEYGFVYDLIYKNYKQYFDWLNIQYYNNGPSDSFNQIFVTSHTFAPGTSIIELINKGYDPSYLVVGKVVSSEVYGGTGYVPLPTLATFVQKACRGVGVLSDWCTKGGEMIWIYYSDYTNLTSNQASDNDSVRTYFMNVPTASG